MQIITYEIPQMVRVRKYSVDCESLCDCLREHKAKKKLNNKHIAEYLNVPITMVEHWFRKDKCFSIPDAEVWFKLKHLLGIKNTEFDESIMTFEEKENVFEKGNRIYDCIGLCPTITCIGTEITILDRSNQMEVKVIGQMDNTIDHTFESANRVYDVGGVSPTINTCGGGGLQPKILEDKTIVAMRGRNPDNPNDRTAGLVTEQRLEPNTQGICNTLTSVQKDNMVMEIKKLGQISSDGSEYGTVLSEDGLSASLVAGTHGYANSCIQQQYRIRKLTPLECWRLMGFTDEDFHKAESVNSNTQLYKQAGNSIVKNVLVAIFGQMIPGKEEVYKNI